MSRKTLGLIVGIALLIPDAVNASQPASDEGPDPPRLAGRVLGLPTDKEPELLKLAIQKFGTLTKADRELFERAATGEVADYRTQWDKENDPEKEKWSEENNPARAAKWGEERVLSADHVAWLCTDPQASKLVTHKGIWVRGARVEGQLDLAFARVPFPLQFENSAFPEVIKAHFCEIPMLSLGGTHAGPIEAWGMSVKHDVVLARGFSAQGPVDLRSAAIGGSLNCNGGRFVSPGLEALKADAAKAGYVLLGKGFRAEGGVRLVRAAIAGDLDCAGGQFVNPKGVALYADGIMAAQVLLREGFRAEGEVRLLRAAIGGDFDCTGGQFVNPGGKALNVQGMAAGHVLLREGFKAEGEVTLRQATILGRFEWINVASPELAILDLRSASVGTLFDDDHSCPRKENLLLHGLIYEEIDDLAPTDAPGRIEWLHRQPSKPFRPQPYEQLAQALRKSGRDEDAKRILIAKEDDRARYTQMGFFERCGHCIFGLSIAYGHRPFRASKIGLVVIAVGWGLFFVARRKGLITATKKEEFASKGTDDGQPYYPKFCALVYSLDMFVPVIDLHQASYWLPNAKRGKELLKLKWFNLRCGGLFRLYLWIHIILGWILTTLFVVGLTGLIRS